MSEKELANHLVKRIKDIGRIDEKLKVILDMECFDNLSKHNEYFDSEHVIEFEKLDTLRRNLICIQELLYEIWEIVQFEEHNQLD